MKQVQGRVHIRLPYHIWSLYRLLTPYSSVSVAELCSSLYVLCRAPAETNGFDVSNYLVEYWALDGANEVQ